MSGDPIAADQALELKVLGSLLHRPTLVPEVQAALADAGGPQAFYWSGHREVYQATLDVYQWAAEATDVTLVGLELGGTQAKAYELLAHALDGGSDYFVSANGGRYALALAQLAKERKLATASRSLAIAPGDPQALAAVLDQAALVQRNGHASDLAPLLTMAGARKLVLPTTHQLLGPLLVKGKRLIVAGEQGHGKSTLIWQMVAAAAWRRDFLGWRGNGCKVLLVDLEQHDDDVRKVSEWFGPEGDDDDDRVQVWREPEGLAVLRDLAQRRAFEQRLDEFAPDVVVIDPLGKLDVEAANSNDPVPALALMAVLDSWRLRRDFALVTGMHTAKLEAEARRKPRPPTLHDLFGSTGYSRGAETCIMVQRTQGQDKAKLWFVKDRHGLLPSIGSAWPLVHTRGKGFERIEGEPETTSAGNSAQQTDAESIETLIMYLAAKGPCPVAQVEAELGWSQRKFQRYVNRAGATSSFAPDGRTKLWRMPEPQSDTPDPEELF